LKKLKRIDLNKNHPLTPSLKRKGNKKGYFPSFSKRGSRGDLKLKKKNETRISKNKLNRFDRTTRYLVHTR
jgi:hypothetical protein